MKYGSPEHYELFGAQKAIERILKKIEEKGLADHSDDIVQILYRELGCINWENPPLTDWYDRLLLTSIVEDRPQADEKTKALLQASFDLEDTAVKLRDLLLR